MKASLALVVTGFIAFTAGWWLGRTSVLDVRSAERLARLESDVERLRAVVGDGPAPTGGGQGPDPSKVYTIEIGKSSTLGPPDAAVTIIELADFECPFCASVAPTMRKLLEVYPDQVRLVFKHNPLPIHPKALAAHKAAVAAGAQGKFWEMHDRLFGAQDKLDREDFKRHARELGLDLPAFERAMDAPETAELIRADQVLAGRMGPMGVPAFFIDGRFIAGAQPYELFRDRIEEELRAR